jgi:NAD(P)-dependent dehydrogenase (short-subunit alcohol dehydrogenase family)
MARIFITGSSDGLGSMAAKLLADQGHKVVLHARNADRVRPAPVARKWPGVYSNAVNPGWVPTKMGGRGCAGEISYFV